MSIAITGAAHPARHRAARGGTPPFCSSRDSRSHRAKKAWFCHSGRL